MADVSPIQFARQVQGTCDRSELVLTYDVRIVDDTVVKIRVELTYGAFIEWHVPGRLASIRSANCAEHSAGAIVGVDWRYRRRRAALGCHSTGARLPLDRRYRRTRPALESQQPLVERSSAVSDHRLSEANS